VNAQNVAAVAPNFFYFVAAVLPQMAILLPLFYEFCSVSG
jgi:hypothetical protein